MYRFALFLILFLGTFTLVSAQGEQDFASASIARTYEVAEEAAEEGDIVAFDAESKTYRLSRLGDVDLTGVIVANPILVLRTGADGVPVVQNGEALVNVSTIGGEISIGDTISISPIPGKGQRAGRKARVIGVAREAFTVGTTTVSVDGRDIHVGTIRVLLGGFQESGAGDISQANAGIGDFRTPGGPIPTAFKYLMALLIAVGSVYLSFRNFGVNIKNGITSIGRNPLAKTTIQTMIVFNIVLIVLVAGGGLILSIAILLLPF